MTLYCFDRCTEQELPALEQLALRLGLKSSEGDFGYKRWSGNPFGKGFQGMLYINYQPHSPESPLTIQLAPSKN
ncbi:MAG: hypothetical protein ABIA37_00695, partial [Candidatus Woesearchaeota archaeon]